MKQFEISGFTLRLVELFLGSPLFPYMKGDYITKNGLVQKENIKHKNREPRHLKTATRHCINETMVGSDNMFIFDIGNEQMEIMHPYYHILQDSPYIRKANESSEKTRGSQAKVEKGKRDYGKVSWNGKSFTKEYARNVRGSRNRIGKVSHWEKDSNGKDIFVNRESNSYLNVHYKYIDRILDSGILNELAVEYGLKPMRKQDTGLGEEYFAQGDTPLDIVGVFSSF